MVRGRWSPHVAYDHNSRREGLLRGHNNECFALSLLQSMGVTDMGKINIDFYGLNGPQADIFLCHGHSQTN